MSKAERTTIGSLLALAIALMASGCGDSEGRTVTGESAATSQQSCVICHLDQTALKALAVEDTDGGHSDSGEG